MSKNKSNPTFDDADRQAFLIPQRRPLNDANQDNFEDQNVTRKRRRRRILSCESCRRIKCRCNFDDGLQTCTRCRTLRIECVRSDDYDASFIHPGEGAGSQSVMERLLDLEKSMNELKTILRGEKPVEHPINQGTQDGVQKPGADRPSGSENDIIPADHGIHIAPAEVVRQIGSQLSGGYRRLLDQANIDLIACQIMDENIANEHISLFIRYHRHLLLVETADNLVPGKSLRQASPFLHAVCCLHGIRFSKIICGSNIHRDVYEHVRFMLGQVVLASPLRLEELLGLLIMSLFTSSPTQGPEYIDSWLLSGHCAQQAILGLRFSDIVTRVNSGSSTSTDYRTIRLWSNTCLHHLHWAAATGRPSIIPDAYVQQCNIILNFYQSTINDAMLCAEIALYSSLHEKLLKPAFLHGDDECDELAAWKQKWAYLFDLPRASTLKMGYHIACLILARRVLEHCRQTRQDETLPLSERSSRTVSNFRNDDRAGRASNTNSDHRTSNTPTYRNLARKVVSLAIQIVQTYLDILTSSIEELSVFYDISVTYAILLISKYDERPEHISDNEVLKLLVTVQKRCTENQPLRPLSFAVDKGIRKIRASDGSNTILGNASDTITNEVTSTLLSDRGIYRDLNALTPEIDNPQPSPLPLDTMEDFFAGGYLGFSEMMYPNM